MSLNHDKIMQAHVRHIFYVVDTCIFYSVHPRTLKHMHMKYVYTVIIGAYNFKWRFFIHIRITNITCK